MRVMSLPFALCVALYGCGQHDQRAAGDSLGGTPAGTAVGSAVDSVEVPDSALVDSGALDSARPSSAEPGAAPRSPHDSIILEPSRPSMPQMSPRPREATEQDSDSTNDSGPPRKFRMPEIRPNYPPVDRPPERDSEPPDSEPPDSGKPDSGKSDRTPPDSGGAGGGRSM